MKTITLSILSAASMLMAASPTTQAADAPKSALDFEMKDIHGKPVPLSTYKGEVLLVVNVASRCGYTPQYKELQAIYKKYADQGFKVIGFPCNQFGGQEPGTEKDILSFCTDNYDVSFPMMSKIDVKGGEQAPLYRYLTANETHGGEVKWNFEKFLISRDGMLAGHFRSAVKPDSEELTAAIEAQLKKAR